MAKSKIVNPFKLTVPTFDLSKGHGNISYTSFLTNLWTANGTKRHLLTRDNADSEWIATVDKLFAHDPSLARSLKDQRLGADAKALWAHYGAIVQRNQDAKGVAASPATSSLVMPALNHRPMEALRYEDVVEMMQRVNPGVELTEESVGTYIDSLRKEVRGPSQQRRLEEVIKRLKSQGKKYWKQRGS